MYLEYYQLKEKPFTLTPNPKYLYYSFSHKEALSQMIYAVTQETGFMALIGEVGTGKTMLINTLIRSLPENYQVANVHYTALRPKGIIKYICNEFKLEFSGLPMSELIFKLQVFFKEQYLAGKKNVLIVDEAQNLSWESLEMIRLLSNSQTMQEKYVQILIVGQPELDGKLKRDDLRQLRERISLMFHLNKLNQKDTSEYIEHRIAVARDGYQGGLFSDQALQRIYEVTDGVPRRINIICDNAMILGYSLEQEQISDEIINEVVSKEGDESGFATSVPAASANKLNGEHEAPAQAVPAPTPTPAPASTPAAKPSPNVKLRIVVRQVLPDLYIGSCPDLKGCHVEARSAEEAQALVKSAIDAYLISCRQRHENPQVNN